MAAKVDPHRFDDLFSSFGPVQLRSLFGGEGVYADGLIIGLVVDEKLYLKTDSAGRAAFTAEGCKPFYFRKDGKRIASSYFAIPDRLYDDPEDFADWARQAQTVSRAKPKTKKRK
jgi:DNA transformation protein and related proteins